MSEPKARAHRTVEVVPGLHRWSVRDERLGGRSSEAYAVVSQDGTVVLIDPLPIDAPALAQLGRLETILLTAGNHQRSAWRLRRLYKVPVWAPQGAHGLEEQPDNVYGGGDSLPGGLVAYHTPGPTEAMYTLWLQRPHSIVFLSDLLTHTEPGTPRFVPSEYQDEPWRTRTSIRRILEHLPVQTLCFAHGPPILQDGAEALRRALEEDEEHFSAPPPP